VNQILLKVDSSKANQMPPFLEPSSSLPYSQEPANGLYSQRDRFSLHHHALIFFNVNSNTLLSFMPIPSKWLIYLFKDAACKSGLYPIVFNARVCREWRIVKDVD
jgi:hypothetical protein